MPISDKLIIYCQLKRRYIGTKILFFFLLSLLLVSCYRILHEPYGTMHFSVAEMDKVELIKVLDDFADVNRWQKVQEGGERMLPDKRKIYVNAIYNSGDSYQITVQNFLNNNCYSAFIYDFKNFDSDFIIHLMPLLRNWLSSNFKERISFHSSSSCG